MSAEPGGRLVQFLLEEMGQWVVRTPEQSGTPSSWELGGLTWKAEIKVDPSSWLGLTFDAVDPASGKRGAHYAIDTDLYDISRTDQRWFADAIESDIIEFLDNLINGQMLRGSKTSGRLVLVFPLNGSFIRLVSGRFLTRGSTHARLADALDGGSYTPVD